MIRHKDGSTPILFAASRNLKKLPEYNELINDAKQKRIHVN